MESKCILTFSEDSLFPIMYSYKFNLTLFHIISLSSQGRGKVFYVGGAVGGGGGLGVVNFCVEILRQIETENRAIAYALS